MQKITFRKLAGEKYIYPELQGPFLEFLGSCIYDGIWVGEDSALPNYHGIRLAEWYWPAGAAAGYIQ